VTLMHRAEVTSWLHGALVVTDKFGGGLAAFNWLGFAVLSLAIVTAPIAVLGVTFANRERSADDELAAIERRNFARTADGQGRVFLKLICKMTSEYTEWRPQDPSQPGRRIPNLKVTETRFWENGAGETYIIDLTG